MIRIDTIINILGFAVIMLSLWGETVPERAIMLGIGIILTAIRIEFK
jgi:hypothetical protein